MMCIVSQSPVYASTGNALVPMLQLLNVIYITWMLYTYSSCGIKRYIYVDTCVCVYYIAYGTQTDVYRKCMYHFPNSKSLELN